jgi:small-conductance mechanosensitive channel
MTRSIAFILIALLPLIGTPALCAPQAKGPSPGSQSAVPRKAPIIFAGAELFSVQGFGTFSAEEREASIAARIKHFADDITMRTDTIRAADADISTDIVTGDMIIMSVTDRDAAATGQPRQELAGDYAGKIRVAIDNYRVEYGKKAILLGLLYTLIAALVCIMLLFLVNRLFRILRNLLETRYRERLHSIQIKTVEIVQVQRVRAIVDGTVKFSRVVIILIIAYAFIHFALGFFPWTRSLADQTLVYILLPLKVIGYGIIKEIPNLLFIVVLLFITRYILKFLGIFFNQIERGTIVFSGFYPEWARPTYRIVRFLLIAFASVVAFPYIPGSSSPAFKGVSIFIGVLFSLGSQSTVTNILAGFSMTYRRLFKVGDRVRIGDFIGDVTGIRLQVTHLHTVKNEEVIVPNSTILNSNVINYSSLAGEKPLILYTSVTIGYDAPWRQVHALLLMAAERTPGLLREPAPFVLQKSLDDFYVSYEMNAYTDRPGSMAIIYSDIHRNIQDCFNEYGVQIMSPHYLADRAAPTVVPKEQWFAPPAVRHEKGNAGLEQG